MSARKKRFIITNTPELSRAVKVSVLSLIYQKIDNKKIIKEHPDGCRVDLDELTPELIDAVESLIKHKLSEEEK